MLKFKKSRSPFRSYSAIFIDGLLLKLAAGILWVVLIVTFGPSVTVIGCKLRSETRVGSGFVVLGTGFVGESDCTGTVCTRTGELAKNCFKKVWFCWNSCFRLEWIWALLLNRIISSTKSLFEHRSIPNSFSCFDLSVDFLVFEVSAHWMRTFELLWGYLHILQSIMHKSFKLR